MIYGTLIDVLRGFDALTQLVGVNRSYADVASQLAIRAGSLDEDDPYPGLVIAIPSIEIDGDLAHRGGFAVATLEVRGISLKLDEAWALMKAAAWNGGDPDDVTRVLSGLDGFRDLSNGLQAVTLKSVTEDPINPDDKSDRRLWVVESTYTVEFDVGTLLRLES